MTYPSHPTPPPSPSEDAREFKPESEADSNSDPRQPSTPAPGQPTAPSHGGGNATGAVHRPQDAHYDPAGKPIEFNEMSVRDQQAGGDLSGREPETRDDNFIDDGRLAGLNQQVERDMGTKVDDFDIGKAGGVREVQTR